MQIHRIASNQTLKTCKDSKDNVVVFIRSDTVLCLCLNKEGKTGEHSEKVNKIQGELLCSP